MGWVILLWEFMCLRKFLYRLPDWSPFRFLLMIRGELVTGPSPSSSEEKLFPWWLYVCVLFAVVSAGCLVVCFVLASAFSCRCVTLFLKKSRILGQAFTIISRALLLFTASLPGSHCGECCVGGSSRVLLRSCARALVSRGGTHPVAPIPFPCCVLSRMSLAPRLWLSRALGGSTSSDGGRRALTSRACP